MTTKTTAKKFQLGDKVEGGSRGWPDDNFDGVVVGINRRQITVKWDTSDCGGKDVRSTLDASLLHRV